VISCKHCGAELPEHARFCLHCGQPVIHEQPAPQGPEPVLDFLQPALAGGMFLGLLSSIPIINAGNCLCGMWILLGGGAAAVMLSRQRASGITYGDGAFVGVLSGLVGAVIGTVIQMAFHVMASRFFESQQQEIEQMVRQFPIEGPARDLLLRVMSGEVSVVTLIITFVSNLLLFSLFAMIGGILAIAILNKRKGAGQRPRPEGTHP
jgi:hypothetical protein